MKNRFRVLILSAALLGAAVPVIAFTTPGAGASTTPTTTTTATTTTTTTTTTSPASPSVKTTPATNITSNSATLTGTVDRNGKATSCYFEYGQTTAYGLQTAPQAVPTTASGTQSFAATVSGLQSKTLFHYQAVCSTASGSSGGGDVVFTTTDHGPSTIRLSGHTGFVSPSGIAGVFIGCYGDRNCTGHLTVRRNGKVIGYRGFYFVAANSGGIVHVPLTPGALARLKAQGSYDVTVSSTTTDGQKLQPGDNGFTLTLHIFR